MADENEEFEFRYRLEQEQASKRKTPKEMRPDPTEGMSAFEKFAAGAGASLTRRARGVGQILGLSTKEDEAEARRLEQPLMSGGERAVEARKYTGPENVQGGRLGVHRGEYSQGVIPGPGAAGAIAGDLIPLAAISSIVPGANTVLGSAAIGGATGLTEPTVEGESRLENTTLGALAGGGSAAVLKGAGMATSKLKQLGTSKAAQTSSEMAVRDQTLKEARALGLNVPPTVAGGGRAAKALESMGGKAATAQEQSIRNQSVVNRVGRDAGGLKSNEPLTESNLEKARDRMSAPYKEVAAISPRAKKALDDLKEARLDSKDAWKKYSGPSGGPSERKAAEAADVKVQKLENLIDREAIKAGKPDLLKRLRSARVDVARNHDVESALIQGSGNIDASVWGRMLDKRGGKAFTGDMAKVARFQQAFPDFARAKPTGQSSPGVGYLKYPLALALGAEGYNVGEQHGIGPYGTAAGLLALAGGPARSIALSKMMQSAPRYGPGMGLRLADLAANNPRLRAMIPSISASVANSQEQ